jgi:hypothetical protein
MRRHIEVIMLLACAIGIADAAEKPAKPMTLPQGMFQVKVTNDHLTLEANQAPLAKVFEEIGKQAAIVIDTNLGPEEKITIQFNHVALEEALHRLARNVTVVYAQTPNGKSHRIARIIVLAEVGKQSPPPKRVEAPSEFSKTLEPALRPLPPKRAGTPTGFSKTIEPAPRPPPFKFEFDPAASMKRENPQKKP